MKQSKIVNLFCKLSAAYPMNMGVEEFFKFWRNATSTAKVQMEKLLETGSFSDAMQLLRETVNPELYPIRGIEDRRILHRTPTGQRRQIQVKHLPSQERERYMFASEKMIDDVVKSFDKYENEPIVESTKTEIPLDDDFDKFMSECPLQHYGDRK